MRFVLDGSLWSKLGTILEEKVDQLKRIRREHQKLLRNTEDRRTGVLKGLSLHSIKKVRLKHEWCWSYEMLLQKKILKWGSSSHEFKRGKFRPRARKGFYVGRIEKC